MAFLTYPSFFTALRFLLCSANLAGTIPQYTESERIDLMEVLLADRKQVVGFDGMGCFP
jgi:hypothetical protein